MSGRLHGLFRARRQNMAAIAHELLIVKREQLYKPLCYTSMAAYGHSEHGLGSSKVSELIAVSEASERLPKIREAFDAGHLDWTKAREITKVATPETEEQWLRKAQAATADELREERKGEPPRRHRGHMFSLEETALYDQLVAGIKEEIGVVSDREALLELMKRGASGARGEAPVQRVVISECGTCGEAAAQTREGAVPVSLAAVEQARCSGETHDLRDEENVVKRAIPAKVQRRVSDRDGRRCLVPDCGAMSALECHHEEGWRNGHDPARMLTLCWWHHRLRHEGLLKIEGSAPDFRFLRVDGTALDSPAVALQSDHCPGRENFACEKSENFACEKSTPEAAAEVRPDPRAERDAFLALRGMEMRAREAKAAVQAALAREPGRVWTAVDLARAALRAQAG